METKKVYKSVKIEQKTHTLIVEHIRESGHTISGLIHTLVINGTTPKKKK